MKQFIRHTVVDMDESLIQRCIYCGEEIANYQNAMWPNGSPAPKGWAAGDVFILPGNPTLFQRELPEGEPFKTCLE